MNSLTKSNRDFLPGLSSVWDDFFSDDFSPRPTGWLRHSMPAVNVKETDDHIELEVAAPGMDKKDFNIEFENNMLVISAEHSDENKEGNKNDAFTRQEFNYRSFRRAFQLPEHMVESDKVKATYNNGILQVMIPKAENAKKKPPRRIQIS